MLWTTMAGATTLASVVRDTQIYTLALVCKFVCHELHNCVSRTTLGKCSS